MAEFSKQNKTENLKMLFSIFQFFCKINYFNFNRGSLYLCLSFWCCLVFVTSIGLLKDVNTVSVYEIIGTDIFFEISEPKELAYTYKIRPAQDFGVPFNSSFSVKNIPLVIVDPPNACGEVINYQEIYSNVAFVQRGECSFLTKALMVEKAGAVAVIVSDDNRDNDDIYIEMIDDFSQRDVNIPAGFLLGKNGYMIVSTLEKLNRNYAIINMPVNLTNVALNKFNQPPWLNW